MSDFWGKVAQRAADESTLAEDFEFISYRLLTEQVLYHTDRNSKTAYGLIDRYERDFRQVLSAIGMDLLVNRQLMYCCAIPKYGKTGSASLAQTLFALVLRKIYDDQARTGHLNDRGEVVCNLVDLEEKYKASTQREMPAKGEFEALIRTMRRWGLARKLEDFDEGTMECSLDGQPYALVIRPAIVDLLGEAAIERLARLAPALTDTATPVGDTDPDTTSNEDEDLLV